MTTKQAAAEAVTALTPPVRAFERAKAKGYVVLDEQLEMFVDLTGRPMPGKNPDQLTLDGSPA